MLDTGTRKTRPLFVDPMLDTYVKETAIISRLELYRDSALAAPKSVILNIKLPSSLILDSDTLAYNNLVTTDMSRLG